LFIDPAIALNTCPIAQDSFDCDGDKEQKCLRLLKNKSDDIERYDHVQFLIREINVAAKSQVDAKKDEVPDDMEFLCEGECVPLRLITWLVRMQVLTHLRHTPQLLSYRPPHSARCSPST